MVNVRVKMTAKELEEGLVEERKTLSPGHKLDRRGLNLYGEDLRGVDLSNVDLTGSRLSGCNLRHCNFRDAILNEANFISVTAQWAKFNRCFAIDANFFDARLFMADLSGADLSKVDLTGANLSRAITTGLILRGASIGDTILGDMDLSTTDLSDLVYSRYRALFGTRTIQRTAQGLGALSDKPDFVKRCTAFTKMLRTCGEPDEIIELFHKYLRVPLYHRTFLVYASDDKYCAAWIHATLRARGVDVLIDDGEFKPGAAVSTETERCIEAAGRMIVLCSKKSLRSDAVEKEVKLGLARAKNRGSDFSIIPVRLDGHIDRNDAKACFKQLSNCTVVNLSWGSDPTTMDLKVIESQMEEVLKSLRIR